LFSPIGSSEELAEQRLTEQAQGEEIRDVELYLAHIKMLKLLENKNSEIALAAERRVAEIKAETEAVIAAVGSSASPKQLEKIVLSKSEHLIENGKHACDEIVTFGDSTIAEFSKHPGEIEEALFSSKTSVYAADTPEERAVFLEKFQQQHQEQLATIKKNEEFVKAQIARAASKKLEEINTQIASATSKKLEDTNTQITKLPPSHKDKPLRFKDALGRVFSFPFNLVSSWEVGAYPE